MKTKSAKETVQSVERCLDIVEAVAAIAEPVGVSALSRQLTLSKATVHRLCQTLLERQFLQQDPVSGRYSPGLRLLDVTSRLLGHFDLSKASRPTLEQMAHRVRENAFAATVVNQCELLIYDEVRVDNAIQPRSLLGLRLALPLAPGGLLSLARLDDEQLQMAVQSLAGRHNLDLQVSPQEIVEQARSLRGSEFCVQASMPYSDVTVISSPITGRRHQVLGVVGFCFPSLRLTEPDQERLGRECAASACVLSSLMGA